MKIRVAAGIRVIRVLRLYGRLPVVMSKWNADDADASGNADFRGFDEE